MENSADGKRVIPKKGKSSSGKLVAVIVIVLLVLLAVAYLALCAWVSTGKILPNTTLTVEDHTLDLSGMTREQAVQTISRESETWYPTSFQLTSSEYPQLDRDIAGEGPLFQLDVSALADDAWSNGRQQGFLGGGIAWLKTSFGGGYAIEAQPQPSAELEQLLTDLPMELTQALDSTLTESTYEVSDTALIIHKGTSGLSVNAADFRDLVIDSLLTGRTSIEVAPHVTPPEALDFEAIYREVYREPVDAYLDKETSEIVPSVTGVSFGIPTAQALMERTEEGQSCEVPLTLTEPEMTTAKLEESLFKDVLGQSSTRTAGPSNRWHNVETACERVNGTILLPGEVFSYNELCEPYSQAGGYLKAGAYVSGTTQDTWAGGVCQLSSTIYYTTLKANLETVERTKHKYDVGYLPSGMDATVYSNSYDFKFKNNTDYPIKIVTTLTKDSSGTRWCNVTIYGTNTTGIYGDPYSVLLSTIPYETYYEPSDSVPQGGQPQRDSTRTGYTGKKVEVHQRLRDADGNVISDTVIHTDTFSVRNAYYFYNPADAALWGIDPATGLRNLTPVSPSPSASATPSPSPSQSVTPSPSPSESATPSPSESVTPTPSPSPSESATPTPSPSPSDSVTPSEVPSASPSPTPDGDGNTPPEGIPIVSTGPLD